MLNRIRKKLESIRHSRSLAKLDSLIEFEAYVSHTYPRDFLFYRGMATRKRIEVQTALTFLSLSVRGKVCLDIGPGHGDALDFWHEEGASACRFIERDPFFYTYNRLKPFATGWNLDHFRYLPVLPGGNDLIWVKGSIADVNFRSRSVLSRWLGQVKGLLSPQGCIVLCPFWPFRGTRRKVQGTRTGWFGQALGAYGFCCLPFVEGHNHEPEYPTTWVYSERSSPLAHPETAVH